MKSNRKKPRTVSAEAIARLADRGKDVSRFFTNSGKMMPPIQRVNVDLTAIMLNELDAAAKELNISRQAVIKTLLRQGLDRHYLAKSRARKLAQRSLVACILIIVRNEAKDRTRFVPKPDLSTPQP